MQTVAVITFAGAGTEFGSLADGKYLLTIRANQVRDAFNNAFDGNGDGTAGDDRQFNFHRLFGDSNGDLIVNYAQFASLGMPSQLGQNVAGHGSAWDHDRQVPILFWWPGAPR